jgi:hypothetical protein
MKKKLILLGIFAILKINFLSAGEVDLTAFLKYQHSSPGGIGLRLGIGGGYQFSTINEIFAPGLNIEMSSHPLSIISSTKIGEIGASGYGAIMLNNFIIKPSFGFNWMYATGLNNIDKPTGDSFRLVLGTELIYKFIGFEYNYFLPKPSLGIQENNEFFDCFRDHRFGIIYHHKFL